MSIKNNYREQLQSDEPIQRIFQLPTILNQAKPISESLASLSFVVPKKANKNQKNNEWRQLPKIGAMSSNYNHLLMLWAKQAELERPIKNAIAENNPHTAVSNINHEDLIKTIGIPALASLADLTELVLVHTDDLLLEMNDFLLEFPKVAKSEIQTKRLQSFGTLLSFEIDDDNERLNASLKRVAQVDYTKLSSLLEVPLEYVENRFSPRYLVDIKENKKA